MNNLSHVFCFHHMGDCNFTEWLVAMWWCSSLVIKLTRFSHLLAPAEKRLVQKWGVSYCLIGFPIRKDLWLGVWLTGCKRRRDKLLKLLARGKKAVWLVNWFRKEVRPAVWLNIHVEPSTGSNVLPGHRPDLAALDHKGTPTNNQSSPGLYRIDSSPYTLRVPSIKVYCILLASESRSYAVCFGIVPW